MQTKQYQSNGYRRMDVEVNLIKENEDGSADYSFNLTTEEAQSLLRFGIMEALKAGLREGDKLKVEGQDVS
jgi:hypothetical protein